jgi:hypothetical protein
MFHATDGLYFDRRYDGAVRVIRKHGDKVLNEWIIAPSAWASLVASVTAIGENLVSWNEALANHMKVQP